jgi:hypothetical protein
MQGIIFLLQPIKIGKALRPCLFNYTQKQRLFNR